MKIRMNSKAMKEFGKIVEKIESSSESTIEITLSRRSPVFQDRATWLAATSDYYKSECGRDVILANPDSVKMGASINNPVMVNDISIKMYSSLYTVFKYTEENISLIVDKYKNWIMNNVILPEGLLWTFGWSLYEVMDNVFQHSGAKYGYISMQYHYKTKKLNIAVTDIGKGIVRSMGESLAREDSKIDRDIFMDYFTESKYGEIIKYAVNKGVTSKGDNNKGMGLYGLTEAVRQNGGTFIIDSGKGSYEYNSQNDEPSKTREFIYSPIEFVNGDNVKYLTCVNWSLDISNPVNMSSILDVEYTSSETDEYYDEDLQCHVVNMIKYEAQVATRNGGAKVSNVIGNLVNDGAEHILLDFESIDIISSSFADEIIKAEMRYPRRIFFRNRSDEIILVLKYARNDRNIFIGTENN
ncbi:DUF4325 domain-containing protein [Rothia mucilaginosa]|uniref:DUF4325 domain-containing protein n=2 Tax=Rothia TaxID=32207 RepID=UPI000B0E063A|nr:DUF4325 domain-containing protein [Rothia mucilaginosa]